MAQYTGTISRKEVEERLAAAGQDAPDSVPVAVVTNATGGTINLEIGGGGLGSVEGHLTKVS